MRFECFITKEKSEHRGPSQPVLKSPAQDRRASSRLLSFELVHLGTVEWRLLKPLLDAIVVQSRGCTPSVALFCSLVLCMKASLESGVCGTQDVKTHPGRYML